VVWTRLRVIGKPGAGLPAGQQPAEAAMSAGRGTIIGGGSSARGSNGPATSPARTVTLADNVDHSAVCSTHDYSLYTLDVTAHE
jgi:hypothetical protein